MSKVTGKFGQCMNIFIIAQNADVVHRKRKILKKIRAEDLRARRSRLDVRQSQTAVNPYPRSLPQRVGRKDRSVVGSKSRLCACASNYVRCDRGFPQRTSPCRRASRPSRAEWDPSPRRRGKAASFRARRRCSGRQTCRTRHAPLWRGAAARTTGPPGAAGSTSGKVKPRSTHTPAPGRRE